MPGTLANAVAAPLIFASLLGRIANSGAHGPDVASFAPLIVAYALVLVAATVFGRIGGWLNWGATLRSFGRAITNGYDHLIDLSHGWHTDRPSGEVIATLETSTWAFVDLIEAMVWGILRISVTTLGAMVVLGIVAWPVALVMATLVAVFGLVLWRRMARVVAAEKEFSDAHSRATGVIADTIMNLTTVRSQAAEDREKGHVGGLVGDSLTADFRARRIFTSTRLQMESAMAFFNWAAVAVGVVLALSNTCPCRGLLDSSYCFPTTAPLMQVASVPDRIERRPSATISARRSGTIAPMPPIRMPRLPKLAKPHIA